MVMSSTQMESELRKFFVREKIKAVVRWHPDNIEVILPSGFDYYSGSFPTTSFNGVIASGHGYDYKVVGMRIIVFQEGLSKKRSHTQRFANWESKGGV